MGRDDGEGCLIKQLQRQGFAVILADVLAEMVGPLIKTAKLVDPTVRRLRPAASGLPCRRPTN